MLTKWKKKKESLSSRFLFRIARRSFDLSVPSWRRNASRGRDPQITPRITPPPLSQKIEQSKRFSLFFLLGTNHSVTHPWGVTAHQLGNLSVRHQKNKKNKNKKNKNKNKKNQIRTRTRRRKTRTRRTRKRKSINRTKRR